MTEKTFALIAVIVTMLLIPSVTTVVYATTYMGNVGPDGETGSHTLEETLKIARERVKIVEENPDAGSGTPFLALDGVIGSSIISAGIFGGIASAFFIKGRGGRYAAQGMG